ncbi:MAG: CBS domain-containing protein [Deltaproteobacteria bacterium]|jgi:CBS domain-containing protein
MQSDLRTLLDKKGHAVHTVTPETTALAAVRAMNENRIGAVLVVEHDVPVGIFTERDVLRRVVESEREPKDVPVGELMSSPLVTVEPRMSVMDAMRLMTDRRLRHLPVMEGTRLVGMVSIGDLTKWVTSDLRDEVEQLETYITGPQL